MTRAYPRRTKYGQSAAPYEPKKKNPDQKRRDRLRGQATAIGYLVRKTVKVEEYTLIHRRTETAEDVVYSLDELEAWITAKDEELS